MNSPVVSLIQEGAVYGYYTWAKGLRPGHSLRPNAMARSSILWDIFSCPFNPLSSSTKDLRISDKSAFIREHSCRAFEGNMIYLGAQEKRSFGDRQRRELSSVNCHLWVRYICFKGGLSHRHQTTTTCWLTPQFTCKATTTKGPASPSSKGLARSCIVIISKFSGSLSRRSPIVSLTMESFPPPPPALAPAYIWHGCYDSGVNCVTNGKSRGSPSTWHHVQFLGACYTPVT